jgi:arylsulfatase A-like enzyme
MMTPDEVTRSYALGVTPATIWQYTFGLRDYSPADLGIIGKTYDASLAELDDRFSDLLALLQARGLLDHTVIVLTADHGEYLGEHHLLDHQYYLYRQVLEVPLILYYKGRVPPGHETRPVLNMDIYPTLLELTGVPAPAQKNPFSVSLLRPLADRTRIAAARTQPEPPFAEARKANPAFDPTPYRRGLLTVREKPYSLVVASDGKQELYNLSTDPDELRDLSADQPAEAQKLMDDLGQALAGRTLSRTEPKTEANMTAEEKEILRSLGYVGGTEQKTPNSADTPSGNQSHNPDRSNRR